jgi:nucleoside-diphosphate-sugar epimerase
MIDAVSGADTVTHLLCFGLGYSARVLAKRALAGGWRVHGTSRTDAGAARLQEAGFETSVFGDGQYVPDNALAVAKATHLLVSVPPEDAGDPVLHAFAEAIANGPAHWIGYLSTVGVYGDHQGQWVDEDSELRPVSARSRRRVVAEQAWLEFGQRTGKAVHIFRLAGIYGPGRGAIDNIRAGTARRLDKPGQVFNRIHVEDIATVLEASIVQPRAGAIYNVTDLEPAPPQDVVAFAAGLLGAATPPLIPFETADLSEMARSFYGENKRVSSALVIAELGVSFAYPTYREGLAAIAQAAARA